MAGGIPAPPGGKGGRMGGSVRGGAAGPRRGVPVAGLLVWPVVRRTGHRQGSLRVQRG